MANVKRRYSRRALGTLALVAASVVAPLAPVVAGATTATTGPSQAQITATKSQISQIEATITQEQQKSAVLSQQYDSAVQQEQTIEAQLAATQAQLDATKAAIAQDRAVLAKAAVKAYVLGVAGTSINSLFTSAPNTAAERTQYEQTAEGNLAQAKAALDAELAKLAATQADLHTEQQKAQASVAQVSTLEQQNTAAQQAAQQTLQQVQGTLAQQVAAAAAAEARREAAAAAAAAAAAQQAAAQAAAAKAAAAAQLAAQLGTQKATTAANQAAGSANPSQTASHVGQSGTPSSQGRAAVAAAESQIGVPYVWGGESPGKGFDCSGLTQWAWAQAGVSIPRTSQAQWAALPHVSLSALQPGDLLFYYNLDGTGSVDHVVMYVGSGPYGPNTIVHAPYTGTTVQYSSLFTYGLIGAGRP